jgi:DNA-binding response OmpR family regulator
MGTLKNVRGRVKDHHKWAELLLSAAFEWYAQAFYMEQPSRVRKILLIEDEADLLAAMGRSFREAGLEVLACATFEEGRVALRKQSFDALLTDVRLGAFNGLQLAVVARDLHPEIRIIIYSGFDDPVLRAEAERIDATYLVKPVPFGALIERILQPLPIDTSE